MVLMEESIYRCDKIYFEKKRQQNFVRIEGFFLGIYRDLISKVLKKSFKLMLRF